MEVDQVIGPREHGLGYGRRNLLRHPRRTAWPHPVQVRFIRPVGCHPHLVLQRHGVRNGDQDHCAPQLARAHHLGELVKHEGGEPLGSVKR